MADQVRRCAYCNTAIELRFIVSEKHGTWISLVSQMDMFKQGYVNQATCPKFWVPSPHYPRGID